MGCVCPCKPSPLTPDIVVDNCAICRNHIMDLCKSLITFPTAFLTFLTIVTILACHPSRAIVSYKQLDPGCSNTS